MDKSKMILSVTQVNEYIRNLLNSDDLLAMMIVRGEISNLTIHRSGHIYFTLKDETSVLKSVMFRSSAQRLKFALKEGMNVIVYEKYPYIPPQVNISFMPKIYSRTVLVPCISPMSRSRSALLRKDFLINPVRSQYQEYPQPLE